MENLIADFKKCESCNNLYSVMSQLKMVSWLKEDQLLVISFIEVNSLQSLGDKAKFPRGKPRATHVFNKLPWWDDDLDILLVCFHWGGFSSVLIIFNQNNLITDDFFSSF